MIKYVENFWCFGLIRHIAYGVSISMVACNFHINGYILRVRNLVNSSREKIVAYIDGNCTFYSGLVFKNGGSIIFVT
jgi:hypothetical protein